MDIPSILSTYGGNVGIVAVSALLLLSDRKHSSERRDELRKDIDREQADNGRIRDDNGRLREDNERLRGMVRDRDRRIVELESELRKCHKGEE